ncbi:MAG: cell division ATP-binding protein FtsE [Clostridia bacterium]|nr:cell division ATP-binding protein FtsE [Clostridia bacterium]
MIVFNNVSKVYPNGTRALKNVDLEIRDGEFVFIVGASGAGKTTLTKLLLCEEKLSGGRIMIDHFNLSRMSRFKIPKLRRTMGIVFQDFRLLPDMTVEENIAFAMHVIGEPKKKIRNRVATFLKLVGLEDKGKSMPSELSGGEQQRVALARALVNNPNVIIADEPTANIDPYMAIEIMELLLKINQLGKTVIVITHNVSLVNYYKKRVITIKDGEIASDREGGMFNEDQTV